MTTRRNVFAALIGALVIGIAEAKDSRGGGGRSGGGKSGRKSTTNRGASGGSGGCGSRGGAGYRKANGKCAGKNE